MILVVFDNKCYFALNYISVSSSAALMCWQAYALTLKCRCILTQDFKNCCTMQLLCSTMCQQLCQQVLHKIGHSISLWFYPCLWPLLHSYNILAFSYFGAKYWGEWREEQKTEQRKKAKSNPKRIIFPNFHLLPNFHSFKLWKFNWTGREKIISYIWDNSSQT